MDRIPRWRDVGHSATTADGRRRGAGLRRDDEELALLPDGPEVGLGRKGGIVLTGDLAEIFNASGRSGLLVKVVLKESPAWPMELQGGDRAATIAGQDIVELGAMPTGQSFTASVLRAGQVIGLTGIVP
jgi:hypothetical protein